MRALRITKTWMGMTLIDWIHSNHLPTDCHSGYFKWTSVDVVDLTLTISDHGALFASIGPNALQSLQSSKGNGPCVFSRQPPWVAPSPWPHDLQDANPTNPFPIGHMRHTGMPKKPKMVMLALFQWGKYGKMMITVCNYWSLGLPRDNLANQCQSHGPSFLKVWPRRTASKAKWINHGHLLKSRFPPCFLNVTWLNSVLPWVLWVNPLLFLFPRSVQHA